MPMPNPPVEQYWSVTVYAARTTHWFATCRGHAGRQGDELGADEGRRSVRSYGSLALMLLHAPHFG
jgi:hypothetical protein